jgi:hypothetical protein
MLPKKLEENCSLGDLGANGRETKCKLYKQGMKVTKGLV